MKTNLLLFFLLISCVDFSKVYASIIIVDKNGAGQYTTIQAGINSATIVDTVIVYPGIYDEAVSLNKNIILQGSGYENTIITGDYNPTVTINNGIMKWFQISSTTHYGVNMVGGAIHNCVIKSCSYFGIYCGSGGSATIQNCVIVNCGDQGIYCACGGNLYVVNTISRNNAGGFYNQHVSYNCDGNIRLMYSNGSIYNTYSNIGVIDSNPFFTSSTDFHLTAGSPSWDTGQPTLTDPDGTVSDMGYFGGPDAPIYPVVYEMKTTPSGSNINVQSKARANY